MSKRVPTRRKREYQRHQIRRSRILVPIGIAADTVIIK